MSSSSGPTERPGGRACQKSLPSSARGRQAWRVDRLPPGEIGAFPVVLRRYRGDELPALVEAVTTSLAHLRPWMPWASAEPIERGLAEFIDRAVEQFDRAENFNYAVWDDAAGKLVGGTGLHPRLGPGRIEIGYWVRDGWLRRGIATAAARALTGAAFDLPQIGEVHIHCDEANVVSAGVPRRLGYRLLRVVPDEITAPAEAGRSMEWVTSRDEWASHVLAPGQASSEPFLLRGGRVTVRDFIDDDRRAFLEWSSFDEMYTWMKWRLASREEALAMFERLLKDPARTARPRRQWYLAAIDENGDFLGTVGFDLHEDGTEEFGWYLAPPRWNRGYGTEITRLLLSFGFQELGVPLIWATCDPDNLASRRVLEKCDLEVEGELTIQTWRGSRPKLRMAISRARWDELQAASDNPPGRMICD